VAELLAEWWSAWAALLGGHVTFEWPWVFVLLPAPWLVVRFAPEYQRESSVLRVSFFRRLERMAVAVDRPGGVRRPLWHALLLGLAWLLVLGAAARPVQLGAPIHRETAARDLLLAVDLSGSMSALDLATPENPKQSRLDVVKRVVGDFVARRKGDRLGVVVFGDAPFIQVPFTSDTHVVRELLGQTEVGMAGPRTALGDAVGLCLRSFERSEARDRVAIVLTDGNDTGSLVEPRRAARIAAEQNVRLYVIGVGDPRALGEESLNEDVLRDMASATHGRYLHAQSAQELEVAYAELDRLEPIRHRKTSYQPRRSVAFAPLGAVALAFSLSAVLRALAALWAYFAPPRRAHA
jgi:Ca-activated chloride channel family protein